MGIERGVGAARQPAAIEAAAGGGRVAKRRGGDWELRGGPRVRSAAGGAGGGAGWGCGRQCGRRQEGTGRGTAVPTLPPPPSTNDITSAPPSYGSARCRALHAAPISVHIAPTAVQRCAVLCPPPTPSTPRFSPAGRAVRGHGCRCHFAEELRERLQRILPGSGPRSVRRRWGDAAGSADGSSEGDARGFATGSVGIAAGSSAAVRVALLVAAVGVMHPAPLPAAMGTVRPALRAAAMGAVQGWVAAGQRSTLLSARTLQQCHAAAQPGATGAAGPTGDRPSPPPFADGVRYRLPLWTEGVLRPEL